MLYEVNMNAEAVKELSEETLKRALDALGVDPAHRHIVREITQHGERRREFPVVMPPYATPREADEAMLERVKDAAAILGVSVYVERGVGNYGSVEVAQAMHPSAGKLTNHVGWWRVVSDTETGAENLVWTQGAEPWCWTWIGWVVYPDGAVRDPDALLL